MCPAERGNRTMRRSGNYETISSGQLKPSVSDESNPPKREPSEGEAPPLLRFGIFDLNIQTGELRKAGLRMRLQEQPFKLLSVLLERPGANLARRAEAAVVGRIR